MKRKKRQNGAKKSVRDIRTDITPARRKKMAEACRRYRLRKKRIETAESMSNVMSAKTVDERLENKGPNRVPFVADVRGYDDIAAAIRQRRIELDLSQLDVDEIAGTQTGYCGKIERPRSDYGRFMGELSFKLVMTALRLKIAVVETAPAASGFADRVKVGANRRGANGGKKRK